VLRDARRLPFFHVRQLAQRFAASRQARADGSDRNIQNYQDTVNEEKTRICKVPDGEFDFLGYSVLQAHTERSSSWTDQSCGQAA